MGFGGLVGLIRGFRQFLDIKIPLRVLRPPFGNSEHIRGLVGQMGAARVRVDEETRAAADRLCAALRAAGTYCDVWRN